MKSLLKIVFTAFSLLFLVYLVWPYGPKSISDFKALPDSKKSTLSGDTVEIPNIKAYFSDNYRTFATHFYRMNYQQLSKMPFPPLKLNHPPEYAFFAIKDQTHSTYLEEFTYPLRGSLYVNGLEPFIKKTKEPRYEGATLFEETGDFFETKVTLRYYPTSVWARIVVWFGINLSIVFLYVVIRKVIKNG